MHVISMFNREVLFYVYRWSNDGQYFARMAPDTLSVYETPVSAKPEGIFLYKASIGYVLNHHMKCG